MKIAFTMGCLAVALSAMAQNDNDYSKSVFSGFQNVASINTSGLQTQQQLQTLLPGWTGDVDKLTGVPRNYYGAKVNIPGASLEDKGAYILQHIMPVFGAGDSSWQQLSITRTSKGAYVRFQQVVNSHKVAFALLSARFSADSSGIVQLQNKTYGMPDVSVTPVLSQSEALIAAVKDITNVSFTTKNIGDWEWFPIPTANGYVLHPAWSFTASGTAASAMPVELSGYVDAMDGSLLYRMNDVKETFDVTIKGNVFKNNTGSPATDEPLADLQLTIDNAQYYTDSTGKYSNAVMPAAKNVDMELVGRWSSVSINGAGTGTTDAVTTNGTTYVFPATAGSPEYREVNAYYHVNRVHAFMKTHYPSFTGMDYVLPTNVDLTTGTCNAFYSGSGPGHSGPSINFYAAGGGCNSFAEIGDVIYHEYGHGISDKFYNEQSGTTIKNGALNEGSSDTWAMSITHSPIIGFNAYISGGYIRRYDQGPKVYPQNIQGEVHADGEIIAGTWYDVAMNLGSYDSMAQIFTNTYYSTPDGPTGTEGQVYYDVLIAALMSDDNDNNISNGTPHFVQIVSAFAKHGIYLLAGTTLAHTEVSHQPVGNAIDIKATVTAPYPAYFQGLELYYRKRPNNNWDSLTLTNTGSMVFEGQIPAQTLGIMDYYFRVFDIFSGNNVYFPTGYSPTLGTQSTIPYQFGIGIAAADSNTFETSTTGWSIGNNSLDNATKGIWIWAKPVSSTYQSYICQTGNDHTTGSGKCLVTANAVSSASSVTSADVSNGTTTVLTPIMDLSRYRVPIIQYYRWYSNDRGENARTSAWQVQIRNAANAIWKNVEQTYQSDYNWRRRIFYVTDYFTALDKIQLKFIAANMINNNLPDQGQATVEAAIDDFFIYDDADAVSVKQVSLSKASIYPNPADQQVKIVLPDNKETGTLALYDATGKIVSQSAIQPNTSEYNIDTRSIATGNYFLTIQLSKSIQTIKVSVIHN